MADSASTPWGNCLRAAGWLALAAFALGVLLAAPGCAAPAAGFLAAERKTHAALAPFVAEQAQAELARVTSSLAASDHPERERLALEQRAHRANNALADLEAWDYGLDRWEEALHGQ